MEQNKNYMVVQFDGNLSRIRRHKLLQAVESKSGVFWAHFNESSPHLMVVKFDNDCTGCDVLLQSIQLDNNVQAQLVGTI